MTPESLLAIAQSLRSGQLDLLEMIDSIEPNHVEVDSQVKAFLPESARFDRLREEARDLLAHYPDPGERPLLFGVLIGVKDIFHLDGYETRAGSRLPPERLTGPEGSALKQLRAAGALVLGKTVTTEFAYFAPGPTRNPHNLNHTPGGSSSGSAASVAAGLCPLSLGTQTIGSVIRPASFCGVVGFKPTFGRISVEGVIPLSPSLDHVGYFTPDLPGAALVASILLKDWQMEALSENPVFGLPVGAYLERAGEEAFQNLMAVCKLLESAGFTIRQVPVMEDFQAIEARHGLILAAEAAQVHARWFAEFKDRYHPKTSELIRRGKGISRERLAKALSDSWAFKEKLARLMDDTGVDLWLAPSAPGPAPHGLESTGDPVMDLPWTQVGFPALNLPHGAARNRLPLGIQLVARPMDDERLFVWAGQVAAHLEEDQGDEKSGAAVI